MKYFFSIIICIFFSSNGQSQIYEIGVFAGGSNLIGDVGSTQYIAPNKPAFGAIFKWNRSPRHSYRFSIISTTLEALDNQSDDPRRIERGYTFSNNLLELAAGVEFTFIDFNLHYNGVLATPYLYTGFTAANHDNHYFSNGIQTSEGTNSWAYGIPMAIGFKMTLNRKFILGLEIGARYTFSDELDGSVPETESLQPNFSFGNVNNNDWYMFTGLTLTYTFGRNSCYCKF
ncbi:MAG: hypothetical protein HRT67_05830 [Flavobacteriaceae bacterium]|nr:hypothetical protein [Flavobacteriaceae bacterium]